MTSTPIRSLCLLALLGPTLFNTARTAHEPSATAASLAAASLTPPSARSVRLTVEVTAKPGTNGSVKVALWKGESAFLKGEPYRSIAEPMTDGKAVVVFADIEPGDYAASAFHDKNNNGTLDRNFLGKPKEPFAFSNGAKGHLGPPKWQDAHFELDEANRTISIRLDQ